MRESLHTPVLPHGMLVDAHAHVFPRIDGRIGSGPTRGLAYGRVVIGENVIQALPPISESTCHTPEMLIRNPTTVHFYNEVIGLRLCPCQAHHMDPPHFDVGGAYLAILKGKSVLAQNAETFPLIALAVDDLDSAIERLKAHRVDLLKDVEEDPASRWVFFRDSGGNLIELVHWK